MFSVTTDISLIAIFLFFVGPAFVFIKTTNSFWNLINRRNPNNQAPTITTRSPLNETMTYTLFPLALAGTLFLTDSSNLSPLEGLDDEYFDLMATPWWLIRYSIFTGIVTSFGMLIGTLQGLQTPMLMKIIKSPSRNELSESTTSTCQCPQDPETKKNNS